MAATWTIKEVADYAGVSQRQIRKIRSSWGTFPQPKLRMKTPRFDRDEIVNFFQNEYRAPVQKK